MNIPTEVSRTSPEVRAAVAVFLTNYKRGGTPLSIWEAMTAVRRVYPVSELSDNELTEAISAQAVDAGLDIQFDGPARPAPAQATERWEDEGGAIQSSANR